MKNKKNKPNDKMVTYYNNKTAQTYLIPKAELSSESVCYMNTTTPATEAGVVYADRVFIEEELRKKKSDRPPLTDADKETIKYISLELEYVYPRSYEDWVESIQQGNNIEGQGCDANSEIGFWLIVVDVLEEIWRIHRDNPCRAKNCLSVILACETGWPNTITERSDAPLLSEFEIEEVEGAFYDFCASLDVED